MPTSRYRRGMKTGVAHKSYGVALPMNHGKLDKLFRLLPIWRKGLTYSLNQWCRELFETGSYPHGRALKPFLTICPNGNGIPYPVKRKPPSIHG